MHETLESFIKYLIQKGIIDNEDDQSETIHKFLELYEQFESENNVVSMDESDKINPFETRAIFTLADFLKGLGPNEYYDIASKIFGQWEESLKKKEEQPVAAKIKKLVSILENKTRIVLQRTLGELKIHCTVFELEMENRILREKMVQMMHEKNVHIMDTEFERDQNCRISDVYCQNPSTKSVEQLQGSFQ